MGTAALAVILSSLARVLVMERDHIAARGPQVEKRAA
jgi:hypothetical protein